MNHRYLQKFQIKDVVFLAIMSAVALALSLIHISEPTRPY